jgi:hypothetical protein
MLASPPPTSNRSTYHSALTKLADPRPRLRPTAARVLKTLRADGFQTANGLVSALARQGRAIRPATVETALGELAAMGLAAPDGSGPARRWSPLAPSGDPLLDAVDLRGAMTSGTPSRPGWRTPASRPG